MALGNPLGMVTGSIGARIPVATYVAGGFWFCGLGFSRNVNVTCVGGVWSWPLLNTSTQTSMFWGEREKVISLGWKSTNGAPGSAGVVADKATAPGLSIGRRVMPGAELLRPESKEPGFFLAGREVAGLLMAGSVWTASLPRGGGVIVPGSREGLGVPGTARSVLLSSTEGCFGEDEGRVGFWIVVLSTVAGTREVLLSAAMPWEVKKHIANTLVSIFFIFSSFIRETLS